MTGNRTPSEKISMAHQPPPQNMDAEAALLSAVLMENSTLLDIIPILTPEDFYKSAHAKIYAAVCELFNRGEPADTVTVSEKLRQENQLEKAGGAYYLSTLLDNTPPSANVVYHAKIVRDKSCLRRLIKGAAEISNRCHAAAEDVDDIVSFAQSVVFEVSDEKIKKVFTHIGEIIVGNIDTLEERQKNRSDLTGVASGFKRLDILTAGFQRSDLIILAARPSMGKTAFALNVARNAAVDSGLPVAFFSLEMSKEQLTMRMLSSQASIDSARLRTGDMNLDDFMRITEAATVLSGAPVFIDDSPGLSILEIRAKARRLAMEKDIGLIVIDYLQLMRGSVYSESREREISEISRSLKALAKELNVPVLALSQLNRKLEDRGDKRPQLSDLRESGALEQDADLILFIYRDEVYHKDDNNPHRGKAEIILAKQRNGPTGIATIAFLDAYTRFDNLAPEGMAQPSGY